MNTTNLLEQKLSLQKLPFYSAGTFTEKDKVDYKNYANIEVEIQKNWLKNPDWLSNNKSPYEVATKLPVKGTPVLFIKYDKVKDKSKILGFKTTNYRVEEGTFYGMKVVKDDVKVKVLQGNYIYFIDPTDVIIK